MKDVCDTQPGKLNIEMTNTFLEDSYEKKRNLFISIFMLSTLVLYPFLSSLTIVYV